MAPSGVILGVGVFALFAKMLEEVATDLQGGGCEDLKKKKLSNIKNISIDCRIVGKLKSVHFMVTPIYNEIINSI